MAIHLFTELLPEDEKHYREWARQHYQTLQPISGVWHPVVQDECRKMNEEQHMVPYKIK